MPRLRLVSMVHGFCEAVVRRDPRGKECAHTQVHPVRGGGDLSVVQVTLIAVLVSGARYWTRSASNAHCIV